MAEGYTAIMNDVEHTGEDSADTCMPMMHIDPEDKVWRKRAMRLAKFMEEDWSGINEEGHRHFKSIFFSSNWLDDSPARAFDTPYHVRAVQPALLLWQRTGDRRLQRLFTEWMDGWVYGAIKTEGGKPKGVIPAGIHWPDGSVTYQEGDWWKPGAEGDLGTYEWPKALHMIGTSLLLAHRMTGDDRYLEPLNRMAKIRQEHATHHGSDGPSAPGSAQWCSERMKKSLSGILAKHRFLTGEEQWDPLLLMDANGYVRFRLTGDRSCVRDSLSRSVEGVRLNWESYTSEVRFTDRVMAFGSNYLNHFISAPLPKPDTRLLYQTVTGDVGGFDYFPLNAVQWLTPPKDIAVLVTDTRSDHLTAELYHFGEENRAMGAKFHLLSRGTYKATLLAGTDGDALIADMKLKITPSNQSLFFRLPPRTPCLLRVERRQASSQAERRP